MTEQLSRQSKGKVSTEAPNQQFGKFGNRLLDLHQAADYLSLSFWTVRELVQAGKIRSVRIPHPHKPYKFLKRILVDVEDLARFVEENKRPGN